MSFLWSEKHKNLSHEPPDHENKEDHQQYLVLHCNGEKVKDGETLKKSKGKEEEGEREGWSRGKSEKK